MTGESQISRSDRWVKKPRLPYEQERLSGGPASGNRGGLVAPSCKNSPKLVYDLCPPRGSVQCGEPFAVVWGKSLQQLEETLGC